MLTPMRAAVSRSWKVARIARPSRVRASRRCAPTMRKMEVTKTKTRSVDTETGPSARGVVENGVGTLLATPPQASSSPFWSAIQSPIITSMVVSMEAPRSGRSSSHSHSAPASAPPAMARGMARKKLTDRPTSTAKAAYAPRV
jgi:hypothetical protein